MLEKEMKSKIYASRIAAAALICFIFCLLTAKDGNAQNIQLKNTAENCRKVNGFGANDLVGIATRFKVSASSVRFIGARWDLDPLTGQDTCVFIFDTAKGPVRCTPPLGLVSDDGGKTAFEAVGTPYGASCSR
jgi:hypothetical protein